MASLHKHIKGQTVDYIKIESEKKKSGLIILPVLFNSACPYKNYCLSASQSYKHQETNELSREKMLQKPVAVFDCRTTIVGYLLQYYYSTCMCIQCRRSFPYRADRSARNGKRPLYCMRVLYVHRLPDIYMKRG